MQERLESSTVPGAAPACAAAGGAAGRKRRVRRAWARLIMWLLLAAVLMVASRILVFNVDTEVLQEDRIYLQMIATQFGNGLDMGRTPAGYAEQLAAVRAVQQAVLAAAPDNVPLAMDGGREPKDVFLARSGLCYDRSRVIEKMLSALGMQTRHVAMYQTVEGSKLRTLLRPKVPSHAITEVRTERGWLVIDSNAAWLALDGAGNPYSMADIEAALHGSPVAYENPHLQNHIYKEPFTYVYGLYSRHGRFYRKGLVRAVVNANFRDALYNLVDR